ncbi:spoIIIJ-associated protein [Ligilactobacillus sp. WC1T17]|uniref:RNA-binding protein KhpB n=1 Tax=Ligilactobacillus ruminis TaxID=1623 RepID=A0ABY1A977_9LACO|nr:spoIIIJ-associated protein [Ligilactobacillus ruminis]
MKISAPTVTKAIEQGLNTLGKTREEVEVNVLDEGKKGFLGFGKKDAVIEMAVKEEVKKVPASKPVPVQAEVKAKKTAPAAVKKPIETQAQTEQALREVGGYLAEITKKMGIEAQIDVTIERRDVYYNFATQQEGLLIGKHGKTLNALQLLAQNYFDKLSRRHLAIVLDVADYRKRREETLTYLAKKVGYDALEQRKRMELDSMPAYERKIIHAALADNPKLKTYSRGSDPRRYVVIEPVRR